MRNVYLFISLALLAGCSKKSGPAPEPIVAFGYNRSVFEIGEKIPVVNKSQNVDRYEWTIDYKNDTVKTDVNPVFSGRTTTGVHGITLLGYNSDGVRNGAVNPFIVGRRYLKEVRLSSFSTTRPNGQPWHTDGTGPDLSWSLVNSAGTVIYSGIISPNAQIRAGGHTWPVPTKGVVLSNGSWSLKFYDNKNVNNPELMVEIPVVMTGPPANRDVNGNGSYELTSGSWSSALAVETLQ